MVDSLSYQGLLKPMEEVVENTKPQYIFDFDSNIAYIGFFISLLALIAGCIAAYYSWKGYVYQRVSAEKLEKLVPGQISLYGIAGSLLNTILDIEAIYFGLQNYKSYPLKLILSTASLPDDFIDLNKYEKNKRCYDAAVEIKTSWRNYNVFLNTLIESSLKTKSKSEDVLFFAKYLIEYTKSQIVFIQKFENILFEEKYLQETTASKEKIAYYLLELFFEYIQIIKNTGIDKIDTSRSNFNEDNIPQYTECLYMPKIIDLERYLSSKHYNRLSGVNEELADYTDFDIKTIYEHLKNGEFECVDLLYKREKHLANMDLANFKPTYFTYIEPILLGYKRFEYSLIKVPS